MLLVSLFDSHFRAQCPHLSSSANSLLTLRLASRAEKTRVTQVGVTAVLLADPAFLRVQAFLYLSEHLAYRSCSINLCLAELAAHLIRHSLFFLSVEWGE